LGVSRYVNEQMSGKTEKIMGLNTIYEAPRQTGRPGETVVTSTCGHNCGGRCVVNAHVVDGRIARISTDARPWKSDHPPLPACARGVGQIERVYHPDRLRYPMRRTGPRGSGQYERITWDEALDEVARQLVRVRDTYGNAAILDGSRSGGTSMLHSRAPAKRFLHKFGGCTNLWSNMSCEGEIFAIRMTYGPAIHNKAAGREPTDYVNSKLIVMWGWSPGDGTFGTGTMRYLKEAKKRGVRIVCVDPRRMRTSCQLADEHIFIRPSTDAAALIAMAYVAVSENLHDQAYCDRHVQGFDEATLPPGAPKGASYRAYLMGETDGTPKTPEWASAITGIPADVIRRLAIEFATAKPAALHCVRGTIPPRGLRAGGNHRQCRDHWRKFRSQQRRHRVWRDQGSARRTESHRRPGVLAPAGGFAGAWKKRRLPRRHQIDLRGRRQYLQSGAERQKNGGVAGRCRVHRRSGPFFDADDPACGYYFARHDILGTQRRAYPVVGEWALRDLHAEGDRADVRVSRRYRHLRRSGRARRH
jgi:hypothetical protein